MEFIELGLFARRVCGLLTDDEYLELQNSLVMNPALGDLISSGRGLRKMRWRSRAKGAGKRGGLRVLYYLAGEDRIYMVYIYDKTQQGDLSQSQLRTLALRMEGCR